jgi:hypothetical protein
MLVPISAPHRLLLALVSQRLLLALASGALLPGCGDAPTPPGNSAEREPDAIEIAPPAPASGSEAAPSDGTAGDSDDANSGATAPGDEAVSDPNAPAPPCQPAEGTDGSPGNIGELVALINGLPKPTSLTCLLESLDRPLDVILSRSPLSAQPASGPENPRTFIVLGNLTLTVVPSGRTRSLLELGYASAPGRSIKGEIVFPVRGALTPETLAERVNVRAGTTCGMCHLRESEAADPYYAGAFESDERAPDLIYEIEIEALRAESASCEPEVDAERCEILSALFDHGEVQRTSRWSGASEYEPE